MKYYVYFLVNADTGKVFYVGKGSNGRMYIHKILAKRGVHYNKHLASTILNTTNMLYCKILKTNDEELAYKAEEDYIKLFGLENLCNLDSGGRHRIGFKHSAETIAKLTGNKLSVETKKKISDYNKERFKDPKERLKISIATKKAMARPEVKAKLHKKKTFKNGKPDSRIEKVCPICGKKFKTYPSQNFTHCSTKCEDIARRTGTTITCKFCHKKFYISPAELKRGRKYCSKKCYGDDRSVNKYTITEG